MSWAPLEILLVEICKIKRENKIITFQSETTIIYLAVFEKGEQQTVFLERDLCSRLPLPPLLTCYPSPTVHSDGGSDVPTKQRDLAPFLRATCVHCGWLPLFFFLYGKTLATNRITRALIRVQVTVQHVITRGRPR